MIGAAVERAGLAALRLLDPEAAHRLSIAALKRGAHRLLPAPPPARPVRAMGLTFDGPLGVAAGYDKDAEVPGALMALGCGHVEVGTLTPRAQPGNPRPRAFRLPADRAIINRYGFNNRGHDAAHARLTAARERGLPGVLGVNVGANKDSDDRIADYALGVRRFADVADYLAVNVSSPNTPGLRALQAGEALRRLLGAVAEARAAGPHRPVLLKIAPDLGAGELDDVVAEVVRAGLDGLVVSNTTLAREGLTGRHRGEAGGLSGAPLFGRSTALVREARARLGAGPTIVGVGGVLSADDMTAKLAAGADLVQAYTGLAYRGAALVRECRAQCRAVGPHGALPASREPG